MQGGKNWILPKEMRANRFFWDSRWLEICSNHFFPFMGSNGGIVVMDSVVSTLEIFPYTTREIKYGDMGELGVFMCNCGCKGAHHSLRVSSQ
jgi:hypothetical protein